MVYDSVKRKERYEKNKERCKETSAKRYDERKQHAIDSITAGEILDKHKWDMWCNGIKKHASKHPSLWDYKKRAKKKGVLFDLSKKTLEILADGDCEYCHRSPTTWFGIDRVTPSHGYVIGNVVSCCFDCNNDKSEDDVETMTSRNKRITERVVSNELVIEDCDKVILHKGKQPYSKKVCVRGHVYASQSDATSVIKKSDKYVCVCIKRGTHPDDIFEISDEFYEEYKDSENITKTMFIGFDHYHYYTNM